MSLPDQSTTSLGKEAVTGNPIHGPLQALRLARCALPDPLSGTMAMILDLLPSRAGKSKTIEDRRVRTR
jgi:hypothetical protein